MAKYVYPAIFTKEDVGFSISFPDIKGCNTCGVDLADGIEMANDALALMLYDYEEDHRDIPAASDLSTLSVPSGSFASLISCDTMVYRKRNNTRAVKKTLSIPEWLNEAANEKGLNFSQVLQDALKAELGY